MRWLRTLGILVIVGAVVGAIVAFTGPLQQASIPEDRETLEVGLTTLEVNVEASGQVVPGREVPVGFGARYTVREVLVQEGDSVQAGQVLARLDTSDYDLALAGAETSFAREQNAFDSLVEPARDVDLDAAQAAVDAAQAAYWAAGQTATDEEIEIARLQVDAARNQLWQGQLERDLLLNTNIEFRSGNGRNPRAEEIQVQDGVSRLETGVDVAENQFDATRNRGPVGGSASSLSALEQAEVRLENLASPNMDDVEMAALSVQRAALSLERVQVQIVDFEIIAPFDGIVVTSDLQVGELPPNGPAMVIADTNNLTVDVEVDEADVVLLSEGMPVQLLVDALPETAITGTIDQIDFLPLEEENVPTYLATIALDPTLAAVRLGMTATATIPVDELQDVVLIPNRFIEFTQEGAFVNLVVDGTIQRTSIEAGRRTADETQIISGLRPGQRIVAQEVEE